MKVLQSLMTVFLVIIFFSFGNSQERRFIDNCSDVNTFLPELFENPVKQIIISISTADQYTDSGISSYAPVLGDQGGLQYADKDGWYGMNSGEYDYLLTKSRQTLLPSRTSSQGRAFNVYSTCNGSPISPQIITDGNGGNMEVYELEKHTDYLIQYIFFVGEIDGRMAALNTSFGLPIYFKLYSSRPENDCNTPIDLNSTSALPTPAQSGVRSQDRFRPAIYFQYTAAEDGVLRLSKSLDLSPPLLDCNQGWTNNSKDYIEFRHGQTGRFGARFIRPYQIYPDSISFIFEPLPSNLDCSQPLPVTVDGPSVAYELVPWREDPLYYSFVMPESGAAELINSRNRFLRVLNMCGDENAINQSSSQNIVYGNPGQTYIVEFRYSSRSIYGTPQQGSLSIVSRSGSSEPNYSCSSASVVSFGSSIIYPNWTRTNYTLWYELPTITCPGELLVNAGPGFNSSSISQDLFVGTCNDLSQLEGRGLSRRNGNIVLVPLANGEKYFLRVENTNNTSARPQLGFSIDFEAFTVPPPSNSDCINAVPYTTFNQSISIPDLRSASPAPDNIDNCEFLQTQYKSGVWFTFEAPASGSILVDMNTAIYSGTSCSNLNLYSCPSGIGGQIGNNIFVTPGDTYYAFTTRSSFRIRNNTNGGSPASRCDGAIIVEGDNNEWLGLPSRGNTFDPRLPEPCKHATWASTDSWYTFTTDAEVNSIDLLFRVKYGVNIYTGGCGSLTSIYCNSDLTRHTVELNPSTTYFLRIIAKEQNSGRIRFNSINIAENQCATAPSINLSGDPVLVNRGEPFDYSGKSFSCTTDYINDRWVRLTAPSNGIVIVENLNPEADPDTYFVEILTSCTAASISCSSNTLTTFDQLTPGTEYYLHISSASEVDAVTSISSPPAPSTNIDCSSAETITTFSCSAPIEGSSFGMTDGSWYTFEMPTTGGLRLNREGSEQVDIYVGTCNDLLLYSSETGTGTIAIEGMPSGTDIYINVLTNQEYRFCLEQVYGNLNPNYFCSMATTIQTSPNSECSNSIPLELYIAPLTESRPLSRDYWYSFVATQESAALFPGNITSTMARITSILVLDDCDGRVLAGRAGPFFIRDMTIGNTYWLKITAEVISSEIEASCGGSSDQECFQATSRSANVTLDLCLQDILPPAPNDQCTDASVIASLPTTIIDSTHRARNRGIDCRAGSREVWYTFTAADDNYLVISAREASLPIGLSVYENDCSGTIISCGTDSLVLYVSAGTTYKISAGVYDPSNNTTFTMAMSSFAINGSQDNVGVDITQPIVKLQVDGGVAISNSDVALPGNLRYTGQEFQGFTSNGWRSISSINGDDLLQAQDNLGDHSAQTTLEMNDNPVAGLPAPSDDNHAANKGYVDQRVDQLEQSLNNATSSDSLFNIENISWIKQFRSEEANGTGPIRSLEIETNGEDFSIPFSDLVSGWAFNVPSLSSSSNPTIYNDDNFVGIGIEEAEADLHIYNSTTRFGGGGQQDRVFDITADGTHLVVDGRSVSGNQVTPHLRLGTFNQSGINTNLGFDFDLANERLGLGKYNPTAMLHLDKNTVSAYLQIDKNGTTQTVIDGDGHIGIGVPNPSEELEVEGTVKITKNSSSGNPQLNLVETGADYVRLNMTNSSASNNVIASLSSATPANAKINFNIEGTGDVLTVAGNKRIGINDNTPDYTLDVEAQTGTNPFRVGTSSASDTYIKVISNGYVGLGGDPLSDVHIHHDINSSAGLRIENSSGQSGNFWRWYVSSSNSDLRMYSNHSTAARGVFDHDSGVYSSASDRRLKEGISELRFDWSSFMQLVPSNYYFKSDEDKRQLVGLIAQDVEKIYPELVKYDDENDAYTLDYSGTGVIAIKAAQKLKEENVQLKQTISGLQDEVSKLKAAEASNNAAVNMLNEKIESIMDQINNIDKGQYMEAVEK